MGRVVDVEAVSLLRDQLRVEDIGPAIWAEIILQRIPCPQRVHDLAIRAWMVVKRQEMGLKRKDTVAQREEQMRLYRQDQALHAAIILAYRAGVRDGATNALDREDGEGE
jgi:hypothetical protein